jgi:hypothetical protein
MWYERSLQVAGYPPALGHKQTARKMRLTRNLHLQLRRASVASRLSIRNVDRLLEDPGELHNDVSFLATILWHWLLGKDLSENPISHLY